MPRTCHDGGMLPEGDDGEEVMEVECPTCHAKVKVKVADAQRTKKARCPKGHDVPLVQMM